MTAAEIADSDISLALALAAFVVSLVIGTLFVLTTAGLEIVADRTQLATMSAIGVTTRSQLVLTGVQTMILTGLGGLVGSIGGLGLIWLTNTVAMETLTTEPIAVSHPLFVAYGVLVALVIGVVSLPYLLVLTRRVTGVCRRESDPTMGRTYQGRGRDHTQPTSPSKLRLGLAIIGICLAVLAMTLLAGTGVGVLETGGQQFDAADRDLWMTAGETRLTPTGGGGFENTLYDSRNVSAAVSQQEGVRNAVPLAFERSTSRPRIETSSRRSSAAARPGRLERSGDRRRVPRRRSILRWRDVRRRTDERRTDRSGDGTEPRCRSR